MCLLGCFPSETWPSISSRTFAALLFVSSAASGQDIVEWLHGIRRQSRIRASCLMIATGGFAAYRSAPHVKRGILNLDLDMDLDLGLDLKIGWRAMLHPVVLHAHFLPLYFSVPSDVKECLPASSLPKRARRKR